MRTIINGLLIVVLLLVGPAAAWGAADEYERSIRAFLKDNFDQKPECMVVGLIDADGVRIYSAGNLGEGKDRPADADTLFEIGSCTKTFTALLLLEMAERGEVKLDDPVAKYLPEGVKVPARNGKRITLLNLALQDSGLPFNPDNMSGKTDGERLASYTVPKMYDFLSRYRLAQDPGEKFTYSNVGMGLLGHALARKAGEDYEALVVERICEPLKMRSTRSTLTGEMESRFAIGHDSKGAVTESTVLPATAGAGALRSSANDLLKYVSAHLAITPSALTPLMARTREIRHRGTDLLWGNTAMPWMDQLAMNPPGGRIIGHGGGTIGYSAFIGFDTKQRRGVVVLSNQRGRIHAPSLGFRILQHARLTGLDATKLDLVRELVGLGIVMGVDQAKRVQITGVTPNSPAEKANLSGGLIIESIDGIATAGKAVVDCQAMLRGEAGTRVKLSLLEPREKKSREVELTREKIIVGE